jgi:SAM-dependent methyltransferase
MKRDGPEQHRVVQAVFDDWAEHGRADSMASSHEPFTRQAFQDLRLSPDSSYLDIGCGNGYTVRWAAERCMRGHAMGIDISPRMIELARGLSEKYENISFRQSVYPTPDIESDSFDAILSMEVFYYLPDLAGGLQEVRRILKPGGQFACIVDFYVENTVSHSWPDDLDVEMTLLSAAEWRDAVTAAGLAVEKQERLKISRSEATDDWETEEGSLFTLGRKTVQDG